MTGITTITEDSNYGNRLQNYAVQSFLENSVSRRERLFIKRRL